MDISMDEGMNLIYMDITDCMRRCIHDWHAAENLFWIQTYQLIAQSKIVCKSDVMGYVMFRIVGHNSGGNDICYMVMDETEEYLQFERDYHISDVLDELGEQWKRMIGRSTISPIRTLRVWLKCFTGKCMPAINKMISEMEAEGKQRGELTEDDLKERQKAYRATRARFRRLVKKLDAVREYDAVRREDPDYYKDGYSEENDAV